MQNLIYPMQTISFSQLEYGTYSHTNIPAVDMTGTGTGIDYCYAPCDVKIIGIGKNDANTIYFGSLYKVRCADGKNREVTIAMTHCDDISMYKVGQVFRSGEICYKEGKAGKNVTGNHVHIEVADGHHSSKEYVKINGKKYWRFSEKDALKPTDVFFALEGWNDTRKLMGVELVWCKDREYKPAEYPMKLRLKPVKGTQGVRASLSFNKLNKTNAKLLAVIPKGNKEAVVISFIDGLQKDGYQWVKVDYNGIIGYCQWDSRWLVMVEY